MNSVLWKSSGSLKELVPSSLTLWPLEPNWILLETSPAAWDSSWSWQELVQSSRPHLYVNWNFSCLLKFIWIFMRMHPVLSWALRGFKIETSAKEKTVVGFRCYNNCRASKLWNSLLVKFSLLPWWFPSNLFNFQLKIWINERSNITYADASIQWVQKFLYYIMWTPMLCPLRSTNFNPTNTCGTCGAKC